MLIYFFHKTNFTITNLSRTSLYMNFDYLLQQGLAANPQREAYSMFLWLIWYVWKVRNEKCLNAKDISPLDTIHLATQEAETWRVAQLVEHW